MHKVKKNSEHKLHTRFATRLHVLTRHLFALANLFVYFGKICMEQNRNHPTAAYCVYRTVYHVHVQHLVYSL